MVANHFDSPLQEETQQDRGGDRCHSCFTLPLDGASLSNVPEFSKALGSRTKQTNTKMARKLNYNALRNVAAKTYIQNPIVDTKALKVRLDLIVAKVLGEQICRIGYSRYL